MMYCALVKPYYCITHNRGNYTYITVFSNDCSFSRDPIVWLVVSTEFFDTLRWENRLNAYLTDKKPKTSCKKPTDALYV